MRRADGDVQPFGRQFLPVRPAVGPQFRGAERGAVPVEHGQSAPEGAGRAGLVAAQPA